MVALRSESDVIRTKKSDARARATGFIVERYHRAFDEEARQIRVWLLHARHSVDGVLRAVDSLRQQLHAHTALQESQMFPAFEGGVPCPPRTFEAWAADALRLAAAIASVRAACDVVEVGRPLVARVRHLADEIEEHLAEEAKVLAQWSGFGA